MPTAQQESFFFRKSLLGLMAFLIAGGSFSLIAQAPPSTAPGASIEVRIAMEKEQIPLGQSPIVDLTVWNTTDHPVYWQATNYRVHVNGVNGEPPKTMWYRQFLCEPDLPCLTTTLNLGPTLLWPMGLPCDSTDNKFTLSAFYDLTAPGPYSVSLEVPDGYRLGPGGSDNLGSLTTNTVPFNIQAATNSNSSQEPHKP
jgi:hypothetical protein